MVIDEESRNLADHVICVELKVDLEGFLGVERSW